MVPNTKIDPYFGGALDITVYNASRSPVMLTPEMPFCAIIFYQLQEKTATKSIRTPLSIAGKRRGFFARTWERNSEAIIGGVVTVLLAVGGAAVVTYVTIKFTR
jgi:hypothetical protein